MTAESPRAYAKLQILIKHICTWRSKFRYRSQVKLDAYGDVRQNNSLAQNLNPPACKPRSSGNKSGARAIAK